MRQLDVARKARLHRSRVSKLERGQAADLHYGELQRIFEALGAKLDSRPLWRGPQLDRLLDEEHAQMQARWKARLEAWRWLVPAEVSFSQYGERGRIDLLAWHPDSRVLVVIEIKTDFVEAHDLLGTLDVKARLAPVIARELGWEAPAAVVRMVLFKDSSTVRQRVGGSARCSRTSRSAGELRSRGFARHHSRWSLAACSCSPTCQMSPSSALSKSRRSACGSPVLGGAWMKLARRRFRRGVG
jgi:transcriptional regulator with XRE-family HTH domain